MPLASWLFIRGSESIWVERPFGCSLIVAGPGVCREQRDFISDAALNQFQITLAERLAAEGWFLWAYDQDRRAGGDRRREARASARERRLRLLPPT